MTKNVIDLAQARENQRFKQQESRLESLREAFRQARGEHTDQNPPGAGKRARRKAKNKKK